MRHRIVAALGVLTLTASLSAAQTPPAGGGAPVAEDTFFGTATYRLWDGDAPGAVGKGDLDVPTLTMFKPQRGTGHGTAVVIAPGGAYLGLAANLEGRQVADWFAARGVTAFVLRYRLGKAYLYPTPLNDARRAIRFVRARASELGVTPDRIGMMGFSAGGHLTASTGTMFEDGVASASDPIERASSRPDFLVLGYPWLDAMKPGPSNVISYCSVLKLEPALCATFEQYNPDSRVTPRTPPTFIYHTTDDDLVPVESSLTFYAALTKAKVPVEMHAFAKGKHGSGLGLGDPALDLWPSLLEVWLRERGLLKK